MQSIHLEPAPDLAIRRLEVASDQAPASQLLVGGKYWGQPVEGAVLEAAFRSGDVALVFLTHDCPYEETLSIHLLDRNAKLMDTASVERAGTTGHFRLLGCAESDTVKFRFFGARDWFVQVLPAPVLQLPVVQGVDGVRRKFGISRHFLIRFEPNQAG